MLLQSFESLHRVVHSAHLLTNKNARCLHFLVETQVALGLCENVCKINSLKLKLNRYQVILHSSYLIQVFHKDFGMHLLSFCLPRCPPSV